MTKVYQLVLCRQVLLASHQAIGERVYCLPLVTAGAFRFVEQYWENAESAGPKDAGVLPDLHVSKPQDTIPQETKPCMRGSQMQGGRSVLTMQVYWFSTELFTDTGQDFMHGLSLLKRGICVIEIWDFDNSRNSPHMR